MAMPDDAQAFDLVVLGAGPAGANAALEASSRGLRVAVLDDAPEPGGQVWRAPRTALARRLTDGDADRRAGERLRRALREAAVTRFAETTVWSVTHGFEIAASTPDRSIRLRAPALVAALGAVERVVPFPGWELPGVFGLAAATTLLKREGRLPGRDVVLAGQGPLLVAVAAKAIAAGTSPRLVVDAAVRGDWLRAGVGFACTPGALARGIGWTVRIVRARVPRRYGATIVAAHGDGRLEAIDVATLGRDGAPLPDTCRRVAADTLFVGNGLSPVAEVPRLLGASLRFDALRGGFDVVRDASGRTSVPGLYAVGDGAGIRGAALAEIAGTLAGAAVAADHGTDRPTPTATPDRTSGSPRQRRHAACADASCRLMRVPDARLGAVPARTVICRCERVTREAIDAAAARGAGTLDELKHLTRLGMGPCQGRLCGENAAVLLALNAAGPANRARIGMLTQRVPLRPIPMDRLVGRFSYDDIPVPSPAPL